MFDFFEKMRQKPVSKRRLIAFGISLFFTGLIFVVWLSVWLPNFFYDQSVEQKNLELESPKDTLLQNIGSAWDGVMGGVSNLKESLGKAKVSSEVEYRSPTTTEKISTTTETVGN
jgi:hypothetical protein